MAAAAVTNRTPTMPTNIDHSTLHHRLPTQPTDTTTASIQMAMQALQGVMKAHQAITQQQVEFIQVTLPRFPPTDPAISVDPAIPTNTNGNSPSFIYPSKGLILSGCILLWHWVYDLVSKLRYGTAVGDLKTQSLNTK